MIITPVDHNLELAKSELVRSPGLHMSEIYNDFYQDAEPKRFVRGTPYDLKRLEMGLMFEELLEEGLKKRMIDRPEEFLTEDEHRIAYSPDLIIFESPGRGTVLGEIKLTWMSSRDVPRVIGVDAFPQKFDKYFTQMKAYCIHLNTVHARLYVLFVNGNYKPPSPELLAWEIQFTEFELQENWQMLLNHAEDKGMLERQRLFLNTLTERECPHVWARRRDGRECADCGKREYK